MTQPNRAIRVRRTASDQQIKPELTLVSLFFNDSHFGDEFAAGSRSTSGPIIRSDRRPRPKKLLADNIGCAPRRKIFDQRNHSKRKLPGTLNKLLSGHDPTLSIRNPQSEIRNLEIPLSDIRPHFPELQGTFLGEVQLYHCKDRIHVLTTRPGV